jgi:zinc protease
MNGDFGRDLERVTGLASLVAQFAAYDLPLTELQNYANELSHLTAEDVRKAFADKIPADRLNIVIAGDASKFLDQVRALYPNVEVINAADINFESSNLR